VIELRQVSRVYRRGADEVRGEVDINEVDFRELHMGQQAEVVPDAYPDRKYPATVIKIYPQVNRQKGTIKVEVKLGNADEYLRPDMSVRINFLADVLPAGAAPQVLVSKTALRRQGADVFVWTVREEQLQRVAVQSGRESAYLLRSGRLAGLCRLKDGS
jgi:multidrug efflux pump subunit AcrA (membrane-fusion protein)